MKIFDLYLLLYYYVLSGLQLFVIFKIQKSFITQDALSETSEINSFELLKILFILGITKRSSYQFAPA